MPNFRTFIMQLKEKVQDTHDTCTLRFEKPSGFDFRPGQFVTMQVCDDNGIPEKIIRSFTMSSAPGDKRVEITVKATGEFSRRLCDSEIGQKFKFSGPFGTFVLAENEKNKVHYFVTGGSGITPYRSFLRHDKNEKLGLGFMLLYSNKAEEDIIYREELDKFAKENRKIRNYYTLTQEIPKSWEGLAGRIDKSMLLHSIVASKMDMDGFIFYLCGPKELINSVIDILRELKVKPENIRTERWN